MSQRMMALSITSLSLSVRTLHRRHQCSRTFRRHHCHCHRCHTHRCHSHRRPCHHCPRLYLPRPLHNRPRQRCPSHHHRRHANVAAPHRAPPPLPSPPPTPSSPPTPAHHQTPQPSIDQRHHHNRHPCCPRCCRTSRRTSRHLPPGMQLPPSLPPPSPPRPSPPPPSPHAALSAGRPQPALIQVRPSHLQNRRHPRHRVRSHTPTAHPALHHRPPPPSAHASPVGALPSPPPKAHDRRPLIKGGSHSHPSFICCRRPSIAAASPPREPPRPHPPLHHCSHLCGQRLYCRPGPYMRTPRISSNYRQ